MCRLLKVSKSEFYAWGGRPMSACAREDIELTARIDGIHRRSRGAYGAPSKLADEHGIHVSCKRVARLMRVPQACAGYGHGDLCARRSALCRVHARSTESSDSLLRQDPIGCGSPISPTSDLGRISVSGHRAGCLVASHRRLVLRAGGKKAPLHRAGASVVEQVSLGWRQSNSLTGR
ncbi:MAG: IS3 family transposase [Gammaproteobacteria bacterium]